MRLYCSLDGSRDCSVNREYYSKLGPGLFDLVFHSSGYSIYFVYRIAALYSALTDAVGWATGQEGHPTCDSLSQPFPRVYFWRAAQVGITELGVTPERWAVSVVTDADVVAGVCRAFNGSVRMCVCVYVCVHSNTKTTGLIIIKLGRRVVHDTSWSPILFEVKK